MIYGIDVASYQGDPDWAAVKASGVSFAFSKVTQGTGYTNPTWDRNKAEMIKLGSDFMPGAYHFLEKGNAAAQVDHFLAEAGDLHGFAVALDVERLPDAARTPDIATARSWVAEYRGRTGGKVLGYVPRWFWDEIGRPDLSFFDGLWQSHYVSGSGRPVTLYQKVPADWWSGYGGGTVQVLQYSSSGVVPGVVGNVDVNGYRGTLDQLKTITGATMAFSAAELEQIRKAVWETDKAPVPKGVDSPDNPTWLYVNLLRETYSRQLDTLAAVGALRAELSALRTDLGTAISATRADIAAVRGDLAAAIAGINVTVDAAALEVVIERLASQFGTEAADLILDRLRERLET